MPRGHRGGFCRTEMRSGLRITGHGGGGGKDARSGSARRECVSGAERRDTTRTIVHINGYILSLLVIWYCSAADAI